MIYYYLNHRDLPVDSIVEPGAWGDAVLNTTGHRFLKMELQFESIRKEVNVNLPSRLTSNFVFDNKDMAVQFQQLQRPQDFLYEVSMIKTDALKHTANMMLIHPELERWNSQFGNARLYWQSADIETTTFREVVTDSPLKILQKVN